MKPEWKKYRELVGQLWEKNKWIAVILAVGLVLLLLPAGGEKRSPSALQEPPAEDALNPAHLEQRLEKVLSQIQGAGEVQVVLSVKSGPRRILAQDGKTSQRADKLESAMTTVVLNGGDHSQQPVPLQQLSPQYRGALVICSGGDDPEVRLELARAVSVLTGLSMDKVSICRKGK